MRQSTSGTHSALQRAETLSVTLSSILKARSWKWPSRRVTRGPRLRAEAVEVPSQAETTMMQCRVIWAERTEARKQDGPGKVNVEEGGKDHGKGHGTGLRR